MKRRIQWKEFFESRGSLISIAFLIAVGLWIFVNSGQSTEEKRSGRIEYLRMPPGLTFERTPVRDASLMLTGSLYRLRSIGPDDLVFPVDLSSARPGTNRVELTIDALRLPLDVEATTPTPRVFNLHLEELVVREVPVKAELIGDVDGGLSVAKVLLNPDRVTVSGPRSLVSKLESVPISVSLMGRKNSFNFNTVPKLTLPGSVEVKENVFVQVEISTVQVTKDFTDVPVVGDSMKALKVEPSLGRVVVEGAQRDMGDLKWQPQIKVEVGGLKRGRYLLRGRVDAPVALKVLAIEPQNFLVEVLE